MRPWEIRKVSGRAFLQDEPLAAYRDLDEDGLEDLKRVHAPRHVGKLEDFLVLDSLAERANPTEEDWAQLQTCWQGQLVAAGTIYCVILEWTERQAHEPAVQGLQQAMVRGTDDFVSAASNAFRSQEPRSHTGPSLGSTPSGRRGNRGLW